MTRFKFEYAPGATPLDPDETAGLIPDYITTQGELNLLERDNILEATNWAFKKKHSDILTVTFVMDLHKRMFNRVWKWAGKQRGSNKNIGVAKEQIGNELGALLGNVDYWIKNKTYNWDELGARFHFKLVWIHVFANGNGRHGRLMTDILMQANGQEPFYWGMKRNVGSSIDVKSELRKEYIEALKLADQNDLSKLVQFVRS